MRHRRFSTKRIGTRINSWKETSGTANRRTAGDVAGAPTGRPPLWVEVRHELDPMGHARFRDRTRAVNVTSRRSFNSPQRPVRMLTPEVR